MIGKIDLVDRIIDNIIENYLIEPEKGYPHLRINKSDVIKVVEESKEDIINDIIERLSKFGVEVF